MYSLFSAMEANVHKCYQTCMSHAQKGRHVRCPALKDDIILYGNKCFAVECSGSF